MGCESSICTVDAIESLTPKSIGIQLFPNPTNGVLNLEMPKNGHYEIKIVNLLGKTLLKDSFFGEAISLDVSPFSTGLVVVQIYANGIFVAAKKVVFAH